MPIMTAAETLRFYASLLLPPCINQSTRAVRAEQVLSVLGLSHCHDTLVSLKTHTHTHTCMHAATELCSCRHIGQRLGARTWAYASGALNAARACKLALLRLLPPMRMPARHVSPCM